MSHSFTAVVVCRKGSLRIPNKNWQILDGVSLIERKIVQLLGSVLIDRICIGSDDTRIAELAEKYSVDFFLRDDKFCDEVSSTPNEMIKDMLSKFTADNIVWAHLTNPFISSELYDIAIDKFISLSGEYDSLFSASRIQEHFWSCNQTPINHDPFSHIHVVAKDLNPVYRQNGGIFIRPYDKMQADGRFIGDRPFLFEVNEIQGWDVNWPWELEAARSLARYA